MPSFRHAPCTLSRLLLSVQHKQTATPLPQSAQLAADNYADGLQEETFLLRQGLAELPRRDHGSDRKRRDDHKQPTHWDV